MTSERGLEARDVVIVGAGPVGLALALGLARHGRDILVLEKAPGTAEHSRAPAIWPATQEILAGLGVIDTFRAEGVELDGLELFDADSESVLLSVPFRELEAETPFPRLLIVPQSRTEALLLDALRGEPTAEVRFACEATELTQGESWVDVRYARPDAEATVRARIVVGCDGAHSRVRETLGADFRGETYAVRAALADVEVDGTEALRFPRLTTRAGLGVAIRIGPTLWRLILPFAEGDPRPLEERVETAARTLLAREYRPVWRSEFRLHRRVSSRFQEGRVVLAGDAAHLNSPVGGQGMNAGIRDASLLADAIVRDLDRGGTEAIATYAKERREEVREGVNRFTDLLTRVLLAGGGHGWVLRPTLRAASLLLRIPPLRRGFLRRLAMLR